MTPFILQLAPGRAPQHATGGKALRLAWLMELGMPVPPAVVVTTEALVVAIREAGLLPLCGAAAAELAAGDGDRARAAGRAVAEALRTVPLPGALAQALADAYGDLLRTTLLPQVADTGAPLFAVRSSAVGEDGGDRSHAGQFESLLNLRGVERVRDAVREVWASWYSDRAIGYRLRARAEAAAARDAEVGPLPAGPVIPPMAVIVQRMVVPRASGMLFTANPVTGDRREMTLEAGPGLGEALAQGRILPDFFQIHRGERLGLRISERGVAAKDRRLMPVPPGSGRLAFRPLPVRLRDRPCLDDDEILALCRMGREVEERIDAPVDVEWTIDPAGTLFLLQARPVTALPRRRLRRHLRSSPLRRRPVMWTQRFSGERWTELATPLGWSIIQPVLHHFTAWEGASKRWLEGTLPTRLYRGRPYFNVTIFRHLAFRPPGGSPPQFLLEMFPPEEQEALKTGPWLPNLGLVGSILWQVVREKRWQRYHFNVLTNHREWEEFRPRFEARIEALPLDFGTVAEGLEAITEGRALATSYMSIHLLSLLFAHLSYEALQLALRSWVGVEAEAIRSALVAGVEANQTLRTNEALWDLAAEARRHPALVEALTGPQIPEPEALFALPGGRRFAADFDRFIDRFGHRSQASYEIFASRWADSPELVLRMVAGYLRGGVDAHPAGLESRRQRERHQAERLVRQRMTRTLARRLLPWRQAAFGQLLELCRRYMALRENQRFSFDLLLFRMKRAFERLGALMERDGLLAQGDDLVFLEIDEVEGLARGSLTPEQATAIVMSRRADFDANRDLFHPDFLEADDHVESPVVPKGARVYEGLGISPGSARGRVRVLRSFDQMERLQPGEILVTRATDPGWTPLFLVASALVLELGSVLSHGAVVAREYGLPAVVNVEGATRVLKDGMEVTVDGDRGRVIVHRAPKDPIGWARDLMETGRDG